MRLLIGLEIICLNSSVPGLTKQVEGHLLGRKTPRPFQPDGKFFQLTHRKHKDLAKKILLPGLDSQWVQVCNTNQ